MTAGRELSLTLELAECASAIPYTGKTIREKISVLSLEASLEGNGLCGAITERRGTTGGFTTLLTLDTVPSLFAAIFGRMAGRCYVSGTRDLYRTEHALCASFASTEFALSEKYGNKERYYPRCKCAGFEFRFHRGEPLHVHLEVDGNIPAREAEHGERVKTILHDTECFTEVGVLYEIDGIAQKNIYGLTITGHKSGGCKTFVRLHRALSCDEIPAKINTLTVTARLFRDCYEAGRYGLFRLRLSNLLLSADETVVNTSDTVIGPLFYIAAGEAAAESFERGGTEGAL